MEKPRLSLWQIWNLSFGFLGIQFGWGLQMANMSTIYRYLGVQDEDIALLWLAAPVTGLLVQPIVGYMSDRTWCRLGRRRPYFLVGAVLSSIALVCMPNAPFWWVAAGLLWMLDASVNVSMEPFRAFVADKLPEEQHTTGFAMQTLLIGLGAVTASALPWMLTNWVGIAVGGSEASVIPVNVKLAFYIGAFVFLFAVLWTIVTTKEYPPADMEAFTRMKEETRGIGFMLRDILQSIRDMPETMRKLAVVQFFTWLTYFLMWLYFVPAVATYTFGAANPQDPLFSQGSDWGGVCFAVYNCVAVPSALFLPLLARKIGKKWTHSVCLLCGGVGLISTWFFIANQYALLITMVLVGIAWASTLAMPYAILASKLPQHKLGFYMGIFNFFIVLPQIAAALGGKYLISMLGNNTLAAIVLAGCSMITAALFMQLVHDDPSPREEVS